MCRRLFTFVLLAFLATSCARRDPTVESLAGSEPQRLSFGPPSEVIASFLDKMKVCWFSGSKGTLSGYRYEKGERPDGEEGGGGYQNIKIYPASTDTLSFEVQFHKYNENTLIVTRNVSLPPDLATRVKRDIQLWALNSPDCGTP